MGGEDYHQKDALFKRVRLDHNYIILCNNFVCDITFYLLSAVDSHVAKNIWSILEASSRCPCRSDMPLHCITSWKQLRLFHTKRRRNSDFHNAGITLKFKLIHANAVTLYPSSSEVLLPPQHLTLSW